MKSVVQYLLTYSFPFLCLFFGAILIVKLSTSFYHKLSLHPFSFSFPFLLFLFRSITAFHSTIFLLFYHKLLRYSLFLNFPLHHSFSFAILFLYIFVPSWLFIKLIILFYHKLSRYSFSSSSSFSAALASPAHLTSLTFSTSAESHPSHAEEPPDLNPRHDSIQVGE